MEQRRYLRCLGQPGLFAPSGELIRFRTKKHLALLIYIAVDPRSHRRERLAELLWPNVSPSEARHSLATALSTLRPRLGPEGLASSRDHVQLARGRVDLDLDRLEAGDVLGTEISGPLPVAAFLEGFDIPDSSEFTHWKDRQQARLLPRIRDALLVLMDQSRRTGDSRKIEQLADRMLALDDLSEEAIRAKMEARAFAGDRLTALEIFEEWKRKLAEELQAVPSDLVEGMAVRLRRRGWERTTLANIPNVPTDQWRGRPFIGRGPEYRVLYEAWEGVRKGTPGHAFILGDSGVGKTTLVERLTTAAGLEGAAISRVQCYDLEREIPYSTMSGLTLGLLDRPGVSATSPEALGELSRTVPQVRQKFPHVSAPSESQGETARIRLTEAFHEMLTAVAEEHPVILIVDDVHLADDVSLAVLHLIMRRAQGQPIMVVLIARPGELPQSPQASRLREAAGSLGIREIELLPMSEGESGEVLASLIPSSEAQPGATERRALVRAAAGYPMVLELLVQDWRKEGRGSLALSVDAMTAEFGGKASSEVSYRHILDRVTRTLDSTTHNVLNLAAILGPRLNDLSMYAIVDLSTGQTMTGMAELVGRRVLRDGAQGLEFVNEMVRAAAYLGVPATLRRILHGNIADRFILEHGRGEADLGLQIAWHCTRAGRGVEATPYLLRGAREAIRSGSPFGAERGLSTALPNLRDGHRSEALVLLAEALQEQSKWEESLMTLDGVASTELADYADVAFVLRTKARRRLGFIEAIELTELPSRLSAFIKSDANISSRLRAAVEAASVMDAFYSPQHALSILDTLKTMDKRALNPDDSAHLLLATSMLFYNLRDLSSSLSCIQEGTNILEGRKTPNSVLAMLYIGFGAILTKQGIYQSSLAAYTQSYQTASRVGNDAVMLQAGSNLSLSLVRLGAYEDAIAWANRTLEHVMPEMAGHYYLPAVQACVLAHAMLGNLDKADETIKKCNELFYALNSTARSQAWTLCLADAYSIMGRSELAEEQGRRATTGANNKIHMDRYIGPYARWVARTSLHPTRLPRAIELIDSLITSIHAYDAIDRADIVNAQVWLSSRSGASSPRMVEMMKGYLSALPSAVEDQLRRMGMLTYC